MLLAKLAVCIAVLAAVPLATTQTRSSLEARFIGNMAYAISDGATTLFTDFPYESGYSRYMTYDGREIRSRTPRSLALITHHHRDHWEPALFSATDWSVIGPADAFDARRIVIYHQDAAQASVTGCSGRCSVPKQGETFRIDNR